MSKTSCLASDYATVELLSADNGLLTKGALPLPHRCYRYKEHDICKRIFFRGFRASMITTSQAVPRCVSGTDVRKHEDRWVQRGSVLLGQCWVNGAVETSIPSLSLSLSLPPSLLNHHKGPLHLMKHLFCSLFACTSCLPFLRAKHREVCRRLCSHRSRWAYEHLQACLFLRKLANLVHM